MTEVKAWKLQKGSKGGKKENSGRDGGVTRCGGNLVFHKVARISSLKHRLNRNLKNGNSSRREEDKAQNEVLGGEAGEEGRPWLHRELPLLISCFIMSQHAQ